MAEIAVKDESPIYSKDMTKFYRTVVWWGEYDPNTFDKNAFLVQLLARSPEEVIEHARKYFGYTDEDFRDALHHAAPGIVMYEDEWLKLNRLYCIDPPLPFPRPAWILKAIEEERKNSNHSDLFG